MIIRRNEATGDLILIFIAWLGPLLLLWFLQKAGYSVGFDVWPLGEDWSWMATLKAPSASDTARRMWGMFDRNPLLVWWYIAAKPLIIEFESGMLILRHLMRLALAIFSYLLFLGVGGRGGRPFALAVGVLIAAFSANGYLDNLQWPLVGVLTVSLLSILSYVYFLEGNREVYGWYAASLILWFVALTSYTLQSGAILAIAVLAFWSASGEAIWSNLTRRLLRVILDVWPYVAIFMLYVCIWNTVSNPRMAAYYSVKPTFSAFLSSVRYGVWPSDYIRFQQWFGGPLSPLTQTAIFIAVAVGFYGLIIGRQSSAKNAFPSPSKLVLIIIVACCVVLPTVAVESSASEVWPPGSRWLMVQPFWLPFLITLSITLLLACLPIRYKGFRIWSVLLATGAAASVMTSLGFNEQQVILTRSERALYSGLRDALIGDFEDGRGLPRYYLIKMEPGTPWLSSDALSGIYSQNWFPELDVSFRLIPNAPATEPAWMPFWKIRFNEDEVGVDNVRFGGGHAPYDQVRAFSFDGQRLRSLAGANQAAFAGLQVEWNRSGPLPVSRPSRATPHSAPSCGTPAGPRC
jgi:hypothetical protein